MLMLSYDGITEKNIRSMSHKELIEAVIRMFTVVEVEVFSDNYCGWVIPTDNLADAFRNRV